MILDIMDVDKFTKVNALPEIKSNLYFTDTGNPDEEGLFSYTLFGNPGSPERKQRMGFIALDGPYLHPQVYNTLIRLDRNMAKIISGSLYVIYDEKTKSFIEADENDPAASSGIGTIFDNWDRLFFKKSSSVKREARLDLLELVQKHEAFITKQIIIPAFFRDMAAGKNRIPEINGMYKKLFNQVSVLQSVGRASFTYNLSRAAVQNSLNEIYNYFLDLLKLKSGFLHASVMSKSVDYGVRTLITAPTFNANTWKEMPADYEHVAVPLTQCLTEFTISVEAWIESWVTSIVQSRTNMYVYDSEQKKVVIRELDPHWKDDFRADIIEKKIYEFVMTPEMRFYPVTIKFEDGIYRPFAFINNNTDVIFESGQINSEIYDKIRYYTWTDVFYLAAMAVVSEKATHITRYPVTSQHSQYFANVRVRSTWKTIPMLIGKTEYPQYPVIDLSLPANKIEALFIDSLEVFPPYLKPLGGDFDGDQISNRGLYSYEANKWVDEYVGSVANAIGINGGSVRNSGDVGSHTLYNLLRNPDKVA